ncbi:hypothetical protein ABPG72_000763 [Tetrahymena utriculariae]
MEAAQELEDFSSMTFCGNVIFFGKSSYKYAITLENNQQIYFSTYKNPGFSCTSQYQQPFSISTGLMVATNQINFQLQVEGQDALLDLIDLQIKGELKLWTVGYTNRAQFQFTFKVNYAGVQLSQTQIKAFKYIIIAPVQSKYPPIYSFKKAMADNLVTNNQKLTGIALDFEIEDQSYPQGINLNWQCKSIGSSSINQKCYDYLQNLASIPQNVQSITIPALTFSPYQTLNFTFSGSKDNKKSLQTIVVVLVELDLIVQLSDLTQLIQVNMNDDIKFNIIYDSNISSDILTYAGAVLQNNNIVGIIDFDYLQLKFRIWDQFNSVKPQNPVVQVRFTVYNPAYIMSSLSITNFNINLPPTDCKFTVQTSIGYALSTVFTLNITGCITLNTPLTYQFFYYSDSSDFQKEILDPNQIKRKQIVDQTPIQQLNTTLPSGNLLIIGQAMDSYLATYNSTIQLTILTIQQKEQQLLNQIDKILQINDSQIKKKKFTDLCILQQIYLPQRSFLSTFSNTIISQLELQIGNQQISSTQSVLNYINNILQNQPQLLGNTFQLKDNNNMILQNLVDSFGMLSSTTQTSQHNITLPNTGSIQLNGNLINLNCQQLTQKYLDRYILELNDEAIKNTTNLFGVAYSTFSQNPKKYTLQFQSYSQQLVQSDPNIKIPQNNVIKPSIKKLNNFNDNTNILNSSNNTFVYKFPNAEISNNTQSCIQQDQETWSSQYCQTNNFTKINGYLYYCTNQSPTTVVDDLKSIIYNKNLKTAFGSQGFLNLSNFSDFYEFAIVQILSSLTVLQVGLDSYGLALEKIYRFSGIGDKIDFNKIFSIAESNQNLQENNLLNKVSINQTQNKKKYKNKMIFKM